MLGTGALQPVQSPLVITPQNSWVKATSKDVFEKFKQCMTGLDQEKLLQVSMDGPSVNNSFLLMLNKERKEEELSDLISIGTCGLHTLHNSFKHGENATEWKLKKLLSSVYKIFHESPSRRSDYEALTAATESEYPLKFCGHCRVENENVAWRAREIWPKIIEIVEFWKSLPKSKQPGQGKPGQNTSYEHLCKIYKDSFIPLKFQFYEEMAKSLNSFLLAFQTDRPMVPFFGRDPRVITTLFLCKVYKKRSVTQSNYSVGTGQDRPTCSR